MMNDGFRSTFFFEKKKKSCPTLSTWVSFLLAYSSGKKYKFFGPKKERTIFGQKKKDSLVRLHEYIN
jgi:hypothetical protein